MPRGDGTGPVGRGPMSGRAAGFCNNFSVPGFANNMQRGFGRRNWHWETYGFGRGFGHCYNASGLQRRARTWYPFNMWANYTDEDLKNDTLQNEEKFLMEKSTYLKKQINDIQKRIEQINKTKEQISKDEKDQK